MPGFEVDFGVQSVFVGFWFSFTHGMVSFGELHGTFSAIHNYVLFICFSAYMSGVRGSRHGSKMKEFRGITMVQLN